jgi:hypothetical protein
MPAELRNLYSSLGDYNYAIDDLNQRDPPAAEAIANLFLNRGIALFQHGRVRQGRFSDYDEALEARSEDGTGSQQSLPDASRDGAGSRRRTG